MTASGLDPDLIRLNVDAARQRKENALADYEAASAELAWWLQGAELAGVTVVRDDGEPDAANIEELFPPAALFDTGGAEPTLRQAIVAHLREHPMIPFPIASIAHALVLRGWMPDRADTQKRVSDMASLMAGEDQLQRIERGVYRLHPRLTVAFEQRPVTDYSRAAEMGMPVPPPIAPDSRGEQK